MSVRPGSTWQWRKVRAQVLERDGWICQWCLRAGEVRRIHPLCSRRGCSRCAQVDHVLHYRDYPELRNDPANLVAACRECNQSRGRGELPPRLARCVTRTATCLPTMAGVGRR